ncbi:unnamed protein product [Mytilus edulis]|uniref:Uncharacterized protein n=1 Tax=Mytilus edulis TaxID=6550 RepID=A0A8S3RZE6_MYTED|nr:unnamed protein product [Mytilus edulis]
MSNLRRASSKEGGKTCIHKGLNRKTENIPAMQNILQSAMRPPKEGGKTCIHKGLNSCNVQENIPAKMHTQRPRKHSSVTRPPKEGGKTCIHKGLNRKHSCNVQSATRPPKEEAKHAYTKALTENIPAMSNLLEKEAKHALLKKEAKHAYTQRP